MKFNSDFVQWALKFGLSKSGVFVTAMASQVASHLIVWLGLANFVPKESLDQIQGGLEQGATMFGMAIVASIYAWLVHRNNEGVKILKEQLNLSPASTPMLDTTGSVGNDTLEAARKVTGITIGQAATSLTRR